jgi:hypothetical protein
MNKYAKNVKSIPPHYREARKLFLMRLAEANGTTVTTALLAGIGYGVDVAKSSSSRAADKNFSSLCAIARSEEKYRRAWLTKRSRVCPICVKAATWDGSIGWEIRYADACTTHGVWLVDTCSCNQPLKVLRSRAGYCCHCNRKLGSVKTSLAPDSVVQLSKLLVDKAAGEHQAQGEAQEVSAPTDLPLDQLQNLVAVLGMYGDPNAPLRRSGSQHVEEMNESWRVTSLAAEVLQDWPHGFRKLLDWLRASNDDGTSFKLGHRFGRLYHRLYHGPSSEHFKFVHVALERYLAEHWPAIFNRANGRFTQAGIAKSWILATEAQRLLKVSPSVLNDLVIRGLLVAERRLTATGRVRIMLLSEAVHALRNSGNCDTVDLGTAAEELGLADDRLRSAMRLLFPNAWKSSSGYWQIPRHDFKKLLELGIHAPVVSKVDFKRDITVSGALKLMHISDDALAWLVAEVRADQGFVVVKGRHAGLRGIGSWILDREILVKASIKQEPKSWKRETETSLTLKQLAYRWEMKQEAVYDLVRLKAVNAEKKRRYDGHWVRMVKRSEIEHFERIFVPARDLARTAATSPIAIVSKLRILGVQPKYGGLNRSRQYFYERTADLAHAMRAWGVQLEQMTR